MAKKLKKETVLEKCGEAFFQKRNKLGYKFKDVEEISGVTSLTISNLEKKKLKNCSIVTLEKIAEALELTLNVSID